MPTKHSQSSEQNTSQMQAAKKAKAQAVAIKTKELAALRSTPAGTSVPGFGG